MRDALASLLEKADLALGSCADIVAEDTLQPLIESVRAVRTRLAYPDDLLVAALAGGTGSGKSSLLNAMTGEELADVGGMRPTTARPAAAIPTAGGAALDGYLDRMGIDQRHTYEGMRLCLLDLPDTDSVELDHRHRVDQLLPVVDVVVWVVDPEKYRDARLHHEYLRPMAGYPDQLIFVLNQVDRLSPDQLEAVRDDLAEALAADGIVDPLIFPVAAAPPSGPPIGVEELGAALEAKRANRATLYGKLLADVAATARALQTAVGTGLDFDARARDVVDRATDRLLAGDLRGATDVLAPFLDELAVASGAVTARKIEAITADVPAHLRRIEGQLSSPPPVRRARFWRRKTEARPPDVGAKARSLVSDAVMRPVRALLARRAVAIASVAELAVEVEHLQSGPAR